MGSLKDKVVLVTGASRGIGRAIAQAVAAEGAVAVVAARDEAKLAETCALIEAAGGRASALAIDVASRGSVETAFAKLLEAHGRIDGLVNNAGVTRDMLAVRMRDEDWQAVIDLNLTSGFRLARAALRGMMRRRAGRIVGITSIVGVTGNAGQANYAAAKAGMIGMSKALAAEVASRGITVNCVAPGFIDTPMTQALNEAQRTRLLGAIPMGRLGEAADVAAAVVFLASDEAAYMTGQTLHVNGGMAMI